MTLDPDRIRAAVAVAREQGWTLKRSVTLDGSSKCLCPLGALALSEGHAADVDEDIETIAEIIGISANEANAFANGFDGKSPTTYIVSRHYPHLHALGAQLHAELLP